MGSSSQPSNQHHFLFPFASLALWLEAEGHHKRLPPILLRGCSPLLYTSHLSSGHTDPGSFSCLAVQSWALPGVRKSWHRKDNTCFRKWAEHQTQHFWAYPKSPGRGPSPVAEMLSSLIGLCSSSLNSASRVRVWGGTQQSETSFPKALPQRMIIPMLSLLIPTIAFSLRQACGDYLCPEEDSLGQSGKS